MLWTRQVREAIGPLVKRAPRPERSSRELYLVRAQLENEPDLSGDGLPWVPGVLSREEVDVLFRPLGGDSHDFPSNRELRPWACRIVCREGNPGVAANDADLRAPLRRVQEDQASLGIDVDPQRRHMGRAVRHDGCEVREDVVPGEQIDDSPWQFHRLTLPVLPALVVSDGRFWSHPLPVSTGVRRPPASRKATVDTAHLEREQVKTGIDVSRVRPQNGRLMTTIRSGWAYGGYAYRAWRRPTPFLEGAIA